MMRRPAALIVGLAVVFAMQAWPVVSVAGERFFVEVEDAGAPLRLALFPLVPPVAELPLTREVLTLDPPDGKPLLTWRLDAPQPPLSLTALEDTTVAGGVSAQVASQERHWSRLPFFGEQARHAGYELPLPFGVSVIYNYVARDIEVTDVRVGIDGAAPASVSNFANFKARSVVNAAVVKADAWVFPFANIYILLGYIHNSSETNIQVTVPRPPPFSGSRQFNITTETELEGFIGGGGLTLAGGYRQFFITADVNYSQTDLGFDDRFRALIASARAGWNGKVGAIPLRLWGGGAYWDTKNIAKSTTDVPGVGPVQFEADQGPAHPWNAVVGVSSAVHRHFELSLRSTASAPET